MNIYAFTDDDGYVTRTITSPIEQDGGIVLESDIGLPPTDGHRFHLASLTWVDVRTQAQQEEAAANQIKARRKIRLESSDWTQLPNGPLSAQQQQDWAAYRQALRDITNQSGYPFTVVWPVPPT
jgi:Phage tail assembly chaperone protein